MTKQEKIRAVAKAFMEEDPEEYAGETLDEVVAQLEQTSDDFIEHVYETFVVPGGGLH